MSSQPMDLLFPTGERNTELDIRESTWEDTHHAYTHFGNKASVALLFMKLLKWDHNKSIQAVFISEVIWEMLLLSPLLALRSIPLCYFFFKSAISSPNSWFEENIISFTNISLRSSLKHNRERHENSTLSMRLQGLVFLKYHYNFQVIEERNCNNQFD